MNASMRHRSLRTLSGGVLAAAALAACAAEPSTFPVQSVGTTAMSTEAMTTPGRAREPTPAPRSSETVSTPAPQPDPAGAIGEEREWHLLFADEFDGDELDPASWARCYWWAETGCTNASNGEEQWYVPEGIEVSDGTLRLIAERRTVTGSDGQPFEYTSGLVSGMGHDGPRRLFQYGYVEMRARVPVGRGLWPAFWMLPATTESKPEIDIMEMLGQQPESTLLYFHWQDDHGEDQSAGTWYEGSDMSDGWHTYAVDWEPDQISWYVDGVARFQVTDDEVVVPHEPMYLVANLAVGGPFATPPDQSTTFPAVFEIDYVRVWRER